jgi:glycosyltransferase involved in cell wall biosynthesis
MADQPLEHPISPEVDRNLQVRFSPDVFRTQTYGGVSRYITELHRGLTARGVDSRILAWLHINAYLRGLPGTVGLDIAKVRPIRARQALTKGTDRALERLWCTRQDRDTIWHKSMFDRRVAVGPRLAVTVYDMIHERYPDQFGSRDVIPESKRPWCDAADVVFAISETTRQDLLERFCLPAEKVKVTHLGVSVVEPAPGPLPFSETPWILYVGDRSKPYKNWQRVLDAVRALGSEGRLACFGSPATADDLAAVEARRLTDRVRFIGGDDHDLARTYRAASVLVYPSLFEGFGLPPLEAMAHGCPVVAARAGAIPEVAGDAALLFEPTDPDALADALTLVLEDGDRAASLRTAGRARAATYTWDRTVAATLDGYRKILR